MPDPNNLITVDANDLVLKMAQARMDGWHQALRAALGKLRQDGVVEETALRKLLFGTPQMPSDQLARLAEARSAVLEELVSSAGSQTACDAKTDVELCEVLRRWRNDLGPFDVKHIVLDNAIERLQRAAGGPLPTDDAPSAP